jgi:hypothetical protein
MKGKLRVLAILLAFTMVFTSVQVPVSADSAIKEWTFYDCSKTADSLSTEYHKYGYFSDTMEATVNEPTSSEYYTFYGWRYYLNNQKTEHDDYLAGTTTNFKTVVPNGGDFYAIWKCKITYDDSGIGSELKVFGNGYEVQDTKLTLQEKLDDVTKTDEETGKKTVYQFAGWTINGKEPTDADLTVTGPRTFNAVWNINYTVTYNADKGTIVNEDKFPKTATATVKTIPQTNDEGTTELKPDTAYTTITLPTSDDIKRIGYLLKGWSTTEDESSLITTATYQIKADTTLTAIWEECGHATTDASGNKETTWTPVEVVEDGVRTSTQHICTQCGETEDHKFEKIELTENPTDENKKEADLYHICKACGEKQPHVFDENGKCTIESCGYQEARISYAKQDSVGDTVTVDPDHEYVLPKTGEAKGSKVSVSTSKNADNVYYRFVEWVEVTDDEDVSLGEEGKEKSYTPTKPENGDWTDVTYKAVFEQAKVVVIVTDPDGEEKVYTSLNDVPDDERANAESVTVTLLDDVTAADPVIDKLLDELQDGDGKDNFVLDLNGHTLKPDKDEEGNFEPIKVEKGDTLTVTDSQGDGTLEIPIVVEGTLILDGCTVDPEGADSVTDENLGLDAVIIVEEDGELDMINNAKVNGDPKNNVVGIITKSDDVSLEVGSEVTGGGTIDEDHSPTGKEEEVGAIVYVQPEGSDKTLDDLIQGDNENDVKEVGTDSIEDSNNKIEFTTGEDVKVEEKPAVTPSSNPGSVSGIVIPTTTGVAAATAADDDAAGSVIRNATSVSGLAASSGGTGTTASSSKSFLHLKATKATKTTQSLSWTKVAGATTYKIYGTDCGSDDYKLLKTVKSTSSRTWKRTGLPANTYYKYYVVAYKQQNGKLRRRPTQSMAIRQGLP